MRGPRSPGAAAHPIDPFLPLAPHHRHLVLVYTGQTRLAKNLLVSVLRRWFRQDTAVAETVDALVQTAEGAEAAVEREDLAALGAHLTAYWGQKRAVAEGAEPEEVSRLIEAIRPHGASLSPHPLAASLSLALFRSVAHLTRSAALGWSLAGAGGGGFLVVLLRDAETGKMAVAQAISGLAQVDEGLSDAQVFEAEVSEQGMEVEVEGATGE